jgi:2'-5' RNA ligase
MHRLFVAFALPEPILDQLDTLMTGLADARWQDETQLHLTLRFIGKADGRQLDDVIEAISGIAFPPVEATLAGVGWFGEDRYGGALWAGVAPHKPLAALHRKLDRAMILLGLEPEHRAYLPHITVARLPKRHEPVAPWVAANTGFASAGFTLDEMTLYDSIMRPTGSHYEPLAKWRAGG